MILSKSSGTHPQYVSVSLHIKNDMKVEAHRNETSDLVVNLGPLVLFFEGDNEVQMRNLLNYYIEGGADLTKLETLWVYDEISNSKSFTRQHPELVERLRLAAGVAES